MKSKYTLCAAGIASLMTASVLCQISQFAVPPSNAIASAGTAPSLPSAPAPRSVGRRLPAPDAPAPFAPPASPFVAPPPISEESKSLFDSLINTINPVTTTVEVHEEAAELETSEPAPFHAGGQDVLNSAGTFGDVSRYLQMFPGVVATSDLSNQMLVRGGHPMENLFVVDGIEMPNINHLAMMGTTGGMGPMIDSAVIQGVTLYTGGYGAQYTERLSSLTSIQLLDPSNGATHAEMDLGIQGAGGLFEKQFRPGNLLVAGHQGFLSFMGNAMGLGDMPSYTNELARFRHAGDQNQLTILHIGGRDSYTNTPCATDPFETTTINSQYSGFRETTGAEWRRTYTAKSFGVATLSDSELSERIDQQDQTLILPKIPKANELCPLTAAESPVTPVYLESANNAFSSAGYRYQFVSSGFEMTSGTSFRLVHPNIQVSQPVGAYSPYSVAPTRADTTSVHSEFASGQTGTFTQITMHPTRSLSLDAGGRIQTFALGSRTTITPRLSIRYRLGESISVHAAYAGYAQLPPLIYMLAYPVNRSMSPMQATHEVVGLDIGGLKSSTVRIEAYNKQYTNIPTSTEYPTVTIHDMVEMLGQQIVWLPMHSQGYGASSGIELSDVTRTRGFQMQGSLAYSRAKFAGLDRILRPSNYDFPWIANLAAVKPLPRGYVISSRVAYATGRPITPFDLADSLTQNRPIYDVEKMNSQRAPYYQRWDAQATKDISVHRLHLVVYAGVDNLLNRSNFLADVWMPRYDQGVKARNPVEQINQVPIFPNFGLRLIIR